MALRIKLCIDPDAMLSLKYVDGQERRPQDDYLFDNILVPK
jgi:hypothetical protein